MAGRFGFLGSPGGGQRDAWFRIGTLEVTTTMFVTLASAVAMVSHAVSVRIPMALALYPDAVRVGQVWRVVTWPLANFISFWSVVTIFFFWYFGSQLEDQLGRRRMASFLAWTTAMLGVLAVLLSAPFGWFQPYLEGLGTLELVVILVWIAERPQARFLFNIPAWVVGLVLVALPVLGYMASRLWLNMLHLIIGLALAAVVARTHGLLQEHAFLPHLGSGESGRSRPRRTLRRRSRGPSGPGSVVTGPWSGSSARVHSDRAKLDALLDKISEGGMDSLSASERKQLDVLRRRIRGE